MKQTFDGTIFTDFEFTSYRYRSLLSIMLVILNNAILLIFYFYKYHLLNVKPQGEKKQQIRLLLLYLNSPACNRVYKAILTFSLA